MPLPTADKRVNFRKLHEGGCFVIPNPFDVGTAKALQHLGFKAIASTSAGFARTIGKPDNRRQVKASGNVRPANGEGPWRFPPPLLIIVCLRVAGASSSVRPSP
jgi:hypothetical protein